MAAESWIEWNYVWNYDLIVYHAYKWITVWHIGAKLIKHFYHTRPSPLFTRFRPFVYRPPHFSPSVLSGGKFVNHYYWIENIHYIKIQPSSSNVYEIYSKNKIGRTFESTNNNHVHQLNVGTYNFLQFFYFYFEYKLVIRAVHKCMPE